MLEIALKLSEKDTEIFASIPIKKYRKVPFYSELYHYTYGQADVYAEEMSELMERAKKTKNCEILEVFSGSAIDSGVMKTLYLKNNYSAYDISFSLHKFQKFDGIDYQEFDCVNDFMGNEKFDLIFGGLTNSSHVDILSMNDMQSHCSKVNQALKDKGIFLLSVFFDTGKVSDLFTYTYEVNEIKFGYNSGKKLFCHLFEMYEEDLYTDVRKYFQVAVITKGRIGKVVDAMWADDYRSRNWNVASLIELANEEKLKFIKKFSKINLGMLVFGKK